MHYTYAKKIYRKGKIQLVEMEENMKILIIDGCPRKGNTWKLTLLAMEKIRRLCPDTEFEEITLSKLNLPFCTGCSNCFRLGPEKCPHYSIVGEAVRKTEQGFSSYQYYVDYTRLDAQLEEKKQIY